MSGTTGNPQCWSKTALTNGTADTLIQVPEGCDPGILNDGIRGVMTGVKDYILDTGGALVAGGSANALTVTTNQSLIAGQLTAGLMLVVQAASANTSTTVTFAPDGLTAAGIKRADGSALAVGSIQANMFLCLVYNSGTSEWWAANIGPGDFPALVTLTDGATVSMGAATSSPLTVYQLTTAQAAATIDAPTGGVDMQRLMLRITASGGTRAPVLATGAGNFAFPTDLGTNLPSVATILRVGAMYEASSNLWVVLAIVNG